MTKTGKYFSFAVSFLLVANQALAAIAVQSRVDRTEMGVGDTVTATVSVSSDKSVDVTEPRIPNLDGFDLVNSWSSQGRSTKLIQGTAGMEFQTMSNYDYNFMITPRKQGRLSLPAFEIVVDGKTYYTQPIVINVSAEGSGAGTPPPGMPAQGGLGSMMDEEEEIFNQLLRRGGVTPPGGLPNNNGAQGGSQNRAMNSPSVRTLPKNTNEAFFIQVEVDKTDVYEGEQVLVNWYIYTRGNLLSLDRLKFPDLKGFWKEIIEEVPALNFTEEFINNVRYKKALLASHALFPIKPGVAVIDEYKIKSTAQIPTSPYGAFGFGPPYTYTKTSERVKINVKALPQEGRPSDFAGAVGNFEVRAQVENANQGSAASGTAGQFPVNQPFALKMRFEGTGNAKLIELPPLNLPQNLELYDTKAESKFFRNGKSYKEFEVLIIPRQEGDITIPAISFSQFDPSTKKYETKRTAPITLKIVAGAGGNQLAENRVQTKGAAPAVVKKDELPPILVSYEARSTLPKMYSWIFWFSLYTVIALVLLLKLRAELGFGKRKKDLSEIMNRRLKKVDGLIEKNDWRAVGVEMTNVIYQILGDVSGQGGASMEITRLLDKAPPSLRREIGTELSQAIEIFQVMSFAPENVVGKFKEKSEMKKNVSNTAKILAKGIDLAEDRQDGTESSKQMT